MKGLGTDEKRIIAAIAGKSNLCLVKAIDCYSQEFKRSLLSDLKDELSGNLEDAIIMMFTNQANVDAQTLRDAMKGLGTDEDRLDEILLFRSGVELRNIQRTYQSKFQRDLFEDLRDECSSLAASLYITALTDRVPHNPNVVQQEVKQLYEAGAGKIGTDEEKFAAILGRAEPQHVEALKDLYSREYKVTLSKAIESEFGTSDDIARSMLNMAFGYGNFIGKRLLKAMEGAGTNEKMLIRLIISHRESGALVQANRYIQAKTNKTLIQWVKDELSGKFEDLMVAIINNFGIHA